MGKEIATMSSGTKALSVAPYTFKSNWKKDRRANMIAWFCASAIIPTVLAFTIAWPLVFITLPLAPIFGFVLSKLTVKHSNGFLLKRRILRGLRNQNIVLTKSGMEMLDNNHKKNYVGFELTGYDENNTSYTISITAEKDYNGSTSGPQSAIIKKNPHKSFDSAFFQAVKLKGLPSCQPLDKDRRNVELVPSSIRQEVDSVMKHMDPLLGESFKSYGIKAEGMFFASDEATKHYRELLEIYKKDLSVRLINSTQ